MLYACNKGMLVAALLLCMAGCAGDKTKHPQRSPHMANTWAEVAKDQILVVGKIEIFPPLKPIEQSSLEETSRNKAMLVFDGKLEVLQQPGRFFRNGTNAVSVGRTFIVAIPITQNYFLGAWVWMRHYGHGFSEEDSVATLPLGVQVASSTRDRAIYLGTVRYFRDEFFDIQYIAIIDEYDEAKKQFEKEFGSSVKLKKNLLKVGRKQNQPAPEQVF